MELGISDGQRQTPRRHARFISTPTDSACAFAPPPSSGSQPTAQRLKLLSRRVSHWFDQCDLKRFDRYGSNPPPGA